MKEKRAATTLRMRIAFYVFITSSSEAAILRYAQSSSPVVQSSSPVQ